MLAATVDAQLVVSVARNRSLLCTRHLVNTEHGYVQDLRVLDDVYLARLPVMLPNRDTPLVACNAHELLVLLPFHDEFAIKLADAADSGTVSDAIARVARLFLQHATWFVPIYNAFCLGHLAASNILRKHKARADTFEHMCAAIAVPPTMPHLVHTNTQPEPSTRTTSSSRLSILARPRQHSLGAALSVIRPYRATLRVNRHPDQDDDAAYIISTSSSCGATGSSASATPFSSAGCAVCLYSTVE